MWVLFPDRPRVYGRDVQDKESIAKGQETCSTLAAPKYRRKALDKLRIREPRP